MTDVKSVESAIEVAADPPTAFHAFTDEMNLWWVRGPINFWSDAHRVVEVRCEPGVGGRIMEVRDRPDSDDVLVRGRITVWEPPHRLCWDSAQDDVATEVSFTEAGSGTLVRVLHTIPVDGQDRGGTAWSRVVPKWFGDWVAERDRVAHEVRDVARVSLGVCYAKPVAAAHFLARAFDFGNVDELPTEEHDPDVGYGHHWLEFRVGNVALIILPLTDGGSTGASTHVPWVYVDDLDAHYRHAKEAGAVIVSEPKALPGDTYYEATDPEGYHWRFFQARPTQR